MDSSKFNWLNVLLIDDSSTILNYVTTVLENEYQIEHIYQASSASEALQVLKNNNCFNLLFVDLNMPNVDGIQLLKQVSDLHFNGYVVLMTGVSSRIVASVESLISKYHLNFVGSLVKPIHLDDFIPIFEKIGNFTPPKPRPEPLKTYEIIRAIKNNDLKVHYQPQVEISERKLVGVEALCRLEHPRLGMVSPDRFIDKAEGSELILHITMAVIKQAMKDWAKWHQLGLTINLSVNASPSSLQSDDFADSILALLIAYNMPAENLCIEVTENILARDDAQELATINRLNMRGVKIALDDFGKEHATIDRVQKLPLNTVKFDKSYFLSFEKDRQYRSALNTSVAIAQQLNLRTCAEGIESRASLELASELRIDIAQGFFIARPMLAKEIIPWANKWKNNS
ncbi:EAL domain-containing response regulator [Thalassotalea marina]|nr:EAL domain-containing response regulator [Thalassotalea marina]